MKADFYIK